MNSLGFLLLSLIYAGVGTGKACEKEPPTGTELKMKPQEKPALYNQRTRKGAAQEDKPLWQSAAPIKADEWSLPVVPGETEQGVWISAPHLVGASEVGPCFPPPPHNPAGSPWRPNGEPGFPLLTWQRLEVLGGISLPASVMSARVSRIS